MVFFTLMVLDVELTESENFFKYSGIGKHIMQPLYTQYYHTVWYICDRIWEKGP